MRDICVYATNSTCNVPAAIHLQHFSKHHVPSVEPRGRHGGNKELRSIRARSSCARERENDDGGVSCVDDTSLLYLRKHASTRRTIGHAQVHGSRVLDFEVLVLKFGSVDGFSTASVTLYIYQQATTRRLDLVVTIILATQRPSNNTYHCKVTTLDPVNK